MPTFSTSVISLAFLAVFLTGAAIGYKWRDNTAKLAESREQQRYTQALNEALEKARVREQALITQLSEIDHAYQQAQQQTDALQADISKRLTAGTLRLRQQWQQCESDKLRLSNTAPRPAVDNASAANRADLAAAIVRAGRQADNQLKACQAVIRQYHSVINQ